LLHSRGDYGGARPFYEQALAMQMELTSLYADAASEIQGLNYLAQLPSTRDRFLSFLHEKAHTPPDQVYGPIWRGKAALTRLLARRQQALLAAKNRATRGLAEQLLSTRRQLARLLLTSTGTVNTHEQRLKDLSERKEDLERQLAQRLPSSVLRFNED